MRLHPAPAPAPISLPAVDHAPSHEIEKLQGLNRVSIDIYRSSTDRSKYLSVPANSDLAAMVFPADTDSDLQSVSLYKQNVEIELGKTAVGLDVQDILGQISKNGFACHGLKFSASLSVGVGMGVST